jgi:hypothetical protein
MGGSGRVDVGGGMPEGGYAAEYQPVVLSGVTELLVHGVGGESPANTLEEPHPIQVAGDGIAGVHRGPMSTAAIARSTPGVG